MADKDFIVKNGIVTGSNTATIGTAAYLVANGNFGIGNSTPVDKLVVSGSITATVNVSAASVNASTGFYGTVQTATQGTIDHNSLANYSSNNHIDHSTVSIGTSSSSGLTGGGDITTTRNLSVVAGAGIAVDATGVKTTSVPNSLTLSNAGSGAVSGTTFNGSVARTISYNSIGAAPTNQTFYIGTTQVAINRGSASLSLSGVSIDGSAGSATNASTATTATNQSGGTVSATSGSFSTNLSFNSGYGSSRLAYGVRAWAKFSGTSIYASGGITSVTVSSGTIFNVNFNFTMVDTNYATLFTIDEGGSYTTRYAAIVGNQNTTYCQVYCYGFNPSGGFAIIR